MSKQKEDVLDALTRIEDIETVCKESIRPIGIINGAFDLLHGSHLRLINEARWRAGTLVALLDSDRKITESKGNTRPIMHFGERAAAIFYSGADIVVEIDNDEDFLLAVTALQPDFRVLGQEYQNKTSRLSHIHTIYTVDRGVHTTTIIDRILEKHTNNER